MVINRINNIKLFALIIGLGFLLSGCSFNRLEPNNLMKPPRFDGKVGKIQKVLETMYDDNISFKYPNSGNYKSSIVFHDINGDGQDEAIAFFKTSNSEKSIHIQTFNYIGEIWLPFQEFTAEYDDVDRVYFEDIDGDGQDEIIVGWSSNINPNQKNIIVYDSYASPYSSFNEIGISEPYMDMAIMDTDNDNMKEIFILQDQQTSKYNSSVKLLKFNAKDFPGKFEILDEIGINSLDLDDIHFTAGKIDNLRYGVIINSYSTFEQKDDIIYWDLEQKKLKKPSEQEQRGDMYHTNYPNIRIYPKDINNDGIIELPLLGRSSKSYTPDIITWCNYDVNTGTFHVIKKLIYNDSEKYTFDIHEKWQTADSIKINTLIDEENRTMTFTIETDDTSLFTITTFSEKEWQLKKSNKFVEIYKGDGLVYAITQINPNKELSITENEIINSFEKINNNWEDL